MIISMTGYGRGQYEKEAREYTVEIKSVNHRYADFTIKMPREISYLEQRVRKELANHIARGKIDVFITFRNGSKIGQEVTINQELAKCYIKQLEQLAQQTNIIQDISVMKLAKFPGVLELEHQEEEEVIWSELLVAIQKAIEELRQMRKIEGEKLAQDLENRLADIEDKTNQVLQNSTGLIGNYIVKLEERIQELLKTDIVDQARLEQEVVLYADKCSVEEEITRLKSHIAQFRQLLKKQDQNPIGKRLDFLIQEMNRETNTIGSKANQLTIINLVVEIKTQIENIREQVQNIE